MVKINSKLRNARLPRDLRSIFAIIISLLLRFAPLHWLPWGGIILPKISKSDSFQNCFFVIHGASTWSQWVVTIKKIDFNTPGSEQAPLLGHYSQFFSFFKFFLLFFQLDTVVTLIDVSNQLSHVSDPPRILSEGMSHRGTDSSLYPSFYPSFYLYILFLTIFSFS